MTQTFAIDPVNGDMVRGADGNLTILSGLDAVLQNCSTAMRAQRNEMIYAQQDGMPMRATAFDQYLPKQFAAAGRVTLAAVDGVVKVQSFTVTSVNNTLRYAAVVKTIYGTGPLNG